MTDTSRHVGIVQTCGARHTGYSADPSLMRGQGQAAVPTGKILLFPDIGLLVMNQGVVVF